MTIQMSKRLSITVLKFATILFFVFFLLVNLTFAQSSSGTVQVTARVVSPVSVNNSEVKLSTHETIAEPISYPILINVSLQDIKNNPLPGRNVVIVSDRGSVDVIEATSKLSGLKAQAEDIEDQANKDQTDNNGHVSFRLTSFFPGEANLSITADNEVELPAQKAIFKPRPVALPLNLNVSLPLTSREIHIISSQYGNNELSPLQSEQAVAAGYSTKVTVPWWLVLPLLIIIIGFPILLVGGFINVKKIKELSARNKQCENRAFRKT